MAKVYIANAFSLQMLSCEKAHDIHTWQMNKNSVREFWRDKIDVVSAIGHPDLAEVVSNELGINVPANRINVRLEKGDTLIVAQLLGGRLPEGATKLPPNFQIAFLGVEVRS